MSYSVKNMVEKPTEGLCSRCDSESLEFYDDGSGRCLNCGRTFRWASEDEVSQDRTAQGTQEIQSETRETETDDEIKQQTTPVPSTSRTNGVGRKTRSGYTPAQGSRASKKSSGRGSLWVGVIGFVLMIVGYVLYSLTVMEIGLEEHIEIIHGLYLLLTSVGVLVAGTGLTVYGATSEDLGENVCLGLLISAALLVAIYLGIGQLVLFL